MMRNLIQARTAFGWIVRILLLYGITIAIVMSLARLPMTPPVMFILNYLPLVPLAVLIIGLFLWVRSLFLMQAADMHAREGKPKRGESLGELMSMLNDEDVDDLRTQVKARIEEQIDSADADEIETFADLLAETKQKHGDR
jgi:hypothetical protein